MRNIQSNDDDILNNDDNSDNEEQIELLNNLPPLEKITLESNYIKENINAFQLIRNRKYSEASEIYKKCIDMAKKLDDNYKIKDSICNYSISLFYTGKLDESLNNLTNIYEKSLKENNSFKKNQSDIDLKSILLDLKILSNLSISYLALNEIEKSKKCFTNLTNILEKQENNQIRLILMKNVLYNFFRVDSIATMKEFLNNKIIITNNSFNDKNDFHKNVIKKIISAFHSYLKNNDIKIWINCLNEEIENLKELKDFNGIIFAIFNLESSIYINSINENDNINKQISLSKFSSLMKVLVGEKNFDESKNELILNSIKQKMELAIKMYNKLYQLETETLMNPKKNSLKQSKINKNNNLNSPFFLKMLLKYAIKYIDSNITDSNLCKQIKTQINKTLEILSDKNFDHSKIKYNNISPEIKNSIENLLHNLLSIYKNNKLRFFFHLYLENTTRGQIKERNDLINNFSNSYYKAILKGDSILKINFNSNGTKMHFYRLNSHKNCIEIFQKEKDSNVDKQIRISSILKITFGIISQNLKKKIQSLPQSNPKLYMSFILKNSSIDLFLNENKIKKWFYGLSYFLNSEKKKYKIISRSKYILNRCKIEMANQIISQNKINLIQEKDSISKIKNLKNTGNSKISFCKLLLLYNSTKKEKTIKKVTQYNEYKEMESNTKQCIHDWETIESGKTEDEYSYESGNQYFIAEGHYYHIDRCKKCGKIEEK